MCSEDELEEFDGVVVEEALIDWKAKVPQVYHLGGLNVDVVHINLALAVSLHGELVKDTLGGMLNAEDHDLVNELSGALRVQILVADRLGDLDILAVVVVANLSSLVVSVVVVLTVIEVEVA